MGQQVLKATGVRGEITPLAHARQDIDTYAQSFASVLNWQVLKEGGVRRRSGTRYKGATKNTAGTRLIPFVFSDSQAFVLEFGVGFVRFWFRGEQVLSGAVPYEIATTYTAADLANIQHDQDGDILFLACKGHKPKELRRYGNTNWTLTEYAPVDGPWLPINDRSNVITSSAALEDNVTVRLTWANMLGINGDTGLKTTDVGRQVRVQFKGKWSYGRITNVIDGKTADILVEAGRGGGGTGASTDPKGGGGGVSDREANDNGGK